MRALILTGLLWAGAAAADELAECMKDCDVIVKTCTDACGKKAKGGPGACKPHCDKAGEECRKDCKDAAGSKPAPEKAP